MAKQRKRNVGVTAFTDDNDDELEVTSEEDETDESEEPVMAKETAKAKSRKAAEAAAEAEEDDEDDDDDETEPVDESDEIDDDEDDDDEEEGSGFTPWIYHKDADWELKDAFENVDKGDTIIVYDVDNDVWYKLAPIKVGELPADPTAE